MTRFLIYSFCGAMDVVLSAILFVCMVHLAEGGQRPVLVAALLPMWSVVYVLCSLLAGRLVSERNAGVILVISCLASLALSLCFVAASGVAVLFMLTAFTGCTTAFFFTPFQVFIKQMDQGHNKGICHSAGLYTFSWSMGYAIGPFVAAYLWETIGWAGCHLFNSAVCLLIAIGIFVMRTQGSGRQSPAANTTDLSPVPSGPDGDSPLPDLAWMAWVFSGLGCMIVSMIRSVFPSDAAAGGVAKIDQGIAMFILSGVQALTGLSLSRGRTWMYRPLPVLGFGAFGLLGLALFALADRPQMFYLAAGCFAVYSGSFYVYFVYHSLVHPSRSSRYVSINEAVVGLAGVSGPMAGGLLAERFSLSTPYLVMLGVLGMALLVQAGVHWRQGRTRSGGSVSGLLTAPGPHPASLPPAAG